MLDEATTLSDEEVRRIVREELGAARKRERASRKVATRLVIGGMEDWLDLDLPVERQPATA